MTLIFPFLPLIGFAAGLFFCHLVYRQLQRKAVLDTPNARSLHQNPVPRGGGIGIWLATLLPWAGVLALSHQIFSYIPLLISLALLIGVSWLDDKKNLPAAIRFLVQIIAVTLGLSFFADTLFFGGIFPLWLDHLLAGFCWLWFINLTNFMDGIDGLSGAQTIHTSLAFALICGAAPLASYPEVVFALLLIGAILAFLKSNWPPAKMFMGDVGSIPLGYMLGFLLLTLASKGYLLIALTLPLYYVADASITLIKRLFAKKKFWHAHREHFYQKAALAKNSHKAVLYPIIIWNAGLLLCSFLALKYGDLALLPAPLLVGALLWYLNVLANKNQA